MSEKTGAKLKKTAVTCCLLVAVTSTSAHAAGINGRVSVSGSIANPDSGDVITTDQQTLRLMNEGVYNQNEWTIHLNTTRRHQQNTGAERPHASDYFRFHTLADSWLDESDADSSTTIGYELDRAVYKRRFDKYTVSVGRQPIDWSKGRLWQPLNVFGAFSPVALDTEYRPGIDAAILEWNPSKLSSMTAAYVFSPDKHDTISDAKNSAIIHYNRLFGKLAELSLIAGQVNNNQVVGASLEGGFRGAGLRVETSYYNLDDGGAGAFSVVGADYKFENSTVIAVELYNNTFGAATEHDMATQQNSLLTQGIQPHLSRNVLGLTAQRDISPLLNAGYTLLAGQLDDVEGDSNYSFLHQVNLKYSLGSQSDVLFSLLHGTGKGTDDQGKVRSEFGEIPTSISAQWSYYF